MDNKEEDKKYKCACGKLIAKAECQCDECRTEQNEMEQLEQYNDYNHNFDDES